MEAMLKLAATMQLEAFGVPVEIGSDLCGGVLEMLREATAREQVCFRRVMIGVR